MTHYVLAALLSFAGVGAALCAAIVAVWNLTHRRTRLLAALYLALSVGTAAALVRSLIRQSTGIACAMPRGQTLAFYGILILFQAFFIWDGLREPRPKA